jgi:hypothetical protein
VRLRLALLWLLACAGWAGAQALPLVVGGVVETGTGLLNQGRSGTGIVRITPFVGAWVQSIGYVRIGYGLWDYSDTDSTGSGTSIEQRDLSLQAGFALGGPERPYIALTYVRARTLSNLGDTEWNEWGAGIGNRFQISPFAAFITEVEYRVIAEHYDRLRELDVSGTRLQLNAGLAVYVY